jgi:hypothetical protein
VSLEGGQRSCSQTDPLPTCTLVERSCRFQFPNPLFYFRRRRPDRHGRTRGFTGRRRRVGAQQIGDPLEGGEHALVLVGCRRLLGRANLGAAGRFSVAAGRRRVPDPPRGRRRAGTRACTVERGHPHGPRISIVPRQINGGVAIQYRACQPLGKFGAVNRNRAEPNAALDRRLQVSHHPTQAPSPGAFLFNQTTAPVPGHKLAGISSPICHHRSSVAASAAAGCGRERWRASGVGGKKLVDRLSTKAKVEGGKSLTSSAQPPPTS